MRIVTWNCCRGDMAGKIAAARELNPDVLLLQETTLKVEEHGAAGGERCAEVSPRIATDLFFKLAVGLACP